MRTPLRDPFKGLFQEWFWGLGLGGSGWEGLGFWASYKGLRGLYTAFHKVL